MKESDMFTAKGWNSMAESNDRLRAENARLRGQCEKYHWLLTRCADVLDLHAHSVEKLVENSAALRLELPPVIHACANDARTLLEEVRAAL